MTEAYRYTAPDTNTDPDLPSLDLFRVGDTVHVSRSDATVQRSGEVLAVEVRRADPSNVYDTDQVIYTVRVDNGRVDRFYRNQVS